ncbi:MAG: hypothetical protein K2I90_11570, partial [Odoribacter sp.]|nr:hypothetical protein [Odoribacter sp.]
QEGDGRFAIKVAPPVFAFVNEPGEGNVWAKRALYDVKYVSERETPVVECQGADGKWKTLETTLTEKNTDEYECLAKGLTPATPYAFRVRLGGHTLDAGNYMTEAETQVPNSGFEDWYSTPGGTKYWEVWYACKKGETPVWNTMNQLTTSEGGNSTTATGDKRNGCRYNANSGTIETSDAHNGNAALIRTVGWGKGNTATANPSGGMGT